VRRFRDSSGPRVALQVAILEFLLLAGTTAEAVRGGTRLSPAAYAVLAVAGAARGVSRRWPVAGYLLALGTACGFALAGYPAGPIYLPLGVTLFILVDARHQLRPLVLAGIGLVLLSLAQTAPAGLSSLALRLANNLPPVVIILAIAYTLVYRRARNAEAREAEARRRVTEERLRIARELHDVVSHSISVINVQAGVAAHVIERRPDQARESLEVIRQTSREVLRELRGILGVLRDEEDAAGRRPAPGLAQLDELVESSRRAGLATAVSVRGEARGLPPDVDLAAYRIVQESLTNVLRHAGPARAEVRLAYEPGRLVVEVVDDGRGAAQADPAGGGHGLAGMRERVAAAGGSIEIGPRVSRGFRVRAVLPDGSRAGTDPSPAAQPTPPAPAAVPEPRA
jgi:signal transduction histidine kinase